MTDKVTLHSLVETILNDNEAFTERELFPVEIKVSADNRITVMIDGMKGVNIDDCALLSKLIEGKFDRDEEDYELIVSSAGLDKPLKVLKQYYKNIGKKICVLTVDGREITGQLITVLNDNEIEIEQEQKNKPATKLKFNFKEIKKAKLVITF